jgi:hypothetical protein
MEPLGSRASHSVRSGYESAVLGRIVASLALIQLTRGMNVAQSVLSVITVGATGILDVSWLAVASVAALAGSAAADGCEPADASQNRCERGG